MTTLCNDNVNTTERFVRAFFGLILLEVILLVPLSANVIAVLSVVALYMVFTAIMAWDPFNLLGRHVNKKESAPRMSAYSATPSHG